MFGLGKVTDLPRRAKLKHGPVFWVILLFVFAIEAMLGINAAFLVHESASIVVTNLLIGTPISGAATGITLVVSLIFGCCLICGGMWVFGWFKDSIEDAKAYVEATGEHSWNINRLHLIKYAIYAIDLMTLLFRSSYFTERGAFALMVFFVILIGLPGPLGAMLYVHEHTPRDRRMSRARQKAEVLVSQDAENAVDIMDQDLLARWADGDDTAYQEHLARIDAMRTESYQREQDAIAERSAKQRNAQRPLPLAPLPNQAGQGSRNHRSA